MKGIGSKFSVSAIGPGLSELKKALKAITVGDAYVVAGVTGKQATVPHEEGKSEELTNVRLALIHELGAPAAGIPARPWVSGSYNKNRGTYRDMLTAVVRKAIVAGVTNGIDGADTYLQGLKLIGLKMATDMKEYVVGGAPIPPPNSPAVLARKLEKGQAELQRRQRKAVKAGKDPATVKVGDPRTLVDTGRMVGAVTWAVRRKGEDPT